MGNYTFYPYRADGNSLTFEFAELSSDFAATGFAQLVLARHPSAFSVEVWRDEELVLTVTRAATGALASLDPLASEPDQQQR